MLLIRNILYLVLSILLFHCSESEYKNPCDPTSQNFLKLLLFKRFTSDTASLCGLNTSNLFGTNSLSNFSYAPDLYYANGASISLSPTISSSGLTFSISPSLPGGISLNTSTGKITGSYVGYGGSSFTYTVQASNSSGSISTSFKLSIFGKNPIQTMQSQCWNVSGTLDASCTAGTSIGQDGQLKKGTTPSFTGPSLVGSTDYITTDNNTGLIWKSCFEGRSGATCIGTLSSLNATTAASTCTSLNSGLGYANRTDWRLASFVETNTVLNHIGTSPATFTSNFPSASGGGTWSSTGDVSNSANAWYISFTDGTIGSTVKTNTNDVHCVSGSSLPAAQFVDNGDDTIVDINTGLIWQKCTNGLSGSSCQTGTATQMNWASALTVCNGLSLNGKTWRLPNINELKTIIDVTTSSPSTNTTFFPVTQLGNYWTSSTYTTTSAAWVVPFGASTFYATNLAKSSNAYTRCVATGP